MDQQILTFRDLIAPITPEVFFNEFFYRKPLHVEGPAERYRRIFSWEDLNDILRMTTIWTSKTLELTSRGRPLPAESYCYAGTSRENERAMRPDFDQVRQHLRDGASLTLNFVGRLTPGLRSLSETFEALLGAPVNMYSFCSWSGVPAYPSHFDTTSVFVCQIDGTKTWHLYEGRMQNAAHCPGASAGDFPQEHHERSKGALQQTILLQPGDLLYIPHGQYHDAVASSEASLHISVAVRHMVAHDFVNLLAGELPKDPLFREHLPHIDGIGASEAYRKRLAERLQQIIEAPQISQELRSFLHGKAFEGVAEFDLPNLQDERHFRVRWLAFRLERGPDGTARLAGPKGARELEAAEAELAEWVLARDYFSSLVFAEAFSSRGPEALAAALESLQRSGLIESM